MRKIYWVVIIVLLVILGYYISKDAPEEIVTGSSDEVTYLKLLKMSEIVAPDSNELIQLINGKGSYEIVPNSASQGVVTVLDDMLAIWKDEERTDVITILTSNTGGSGTFYYLVLFDLTNNTFSKKSEILLGDRIRVTKVGIGELVHDPEANYRLTVQTLKRNDAEPFAVEPTFMETRTFYVTDQLIEEIEVGLDDT